MEEARQLGYRIYLYYLATNDPEININRVKIRVEQKGYSVPDEKVIRRYFRSLALLPDAVKQSDRAYLFDNSGKQYEIVAEITGGKEYQLFSSPAWLIDSIFQKQRKPESLD